MATDLVIHGHFYQPPRENPWTEAVDPEPSAAPYHDWNERIYRECYRANDNARVVNPQGVVEAIVSNYRMLSFNMGPTLLSWMEAHHEKGYRHILESDKASRELHSGHGNAIAQGYNHCILPLCNDRDRRTQIRWGVEDFRHRFGREPEAMWLPETAVNAAVLEDLIAEGLRYVILAPRQCQKIRPLGAGEDAWRDVGDGSVDPGVAYRYPSRRTEGAGIALFFYDGPVAQAIAFENALSRSETLIEKFTRARGGPGRLVHVATDGESYGHHSRWGDRVLAYALLAEAEHQGFRVTNYGAFLEENPPAWEADIKAGPNGEGTAWSCAHGVGRWIRDCGCHTGGEADWNQSWRGPLRAALDHLRDGLAPEFERAGGELLADPWAARDDFIAVVLDPTPDVKRAFFGKHARRALSPEEEVRALSLLDMQRQCLLMYTSCGWFFNDLSGIETIQILKYAARALDYAAELRLRSTRSGFLYLLKQARSNVHGMGDGEALFHRFVEPSRVTFERLAAHFAINALVEGPARGRLGGWNCEVDHFERRARGGMSFASGRVRLEARVTDRSYECSIVALHFGGMDFVCSVKPWQGESVHQFETGKVAEAFSKGLIPGIMTALRGEHGGLEVGLDQVLPDGREHLSRKVFEDLLGLLNEQTSRIYSDNRHQIDLFQAAGFPLPSELRSAAEYTLSQQFEAEIRAQRESNDPRAYEKAVALAREAQALGYKLDAAEASRVFGDMITAAVQRCGDSFEPTTMRQALELLRLTRELGLKPDLERAQEIASRAENLRHRQEDVVELAGLLWLDPALLLKKQEV
jgi:alpha-amylase/alpha-mannosidase (GH57 family)